ncbi:glutathione S-transferase family protein [Vulgatibacter incomptus]|uniref:Glutathione S-transferase n=1 Tax=Vulgatibacter incomptus TaxID=1391653 RepID=A0A0K1PHX3_9BACT|nr:glutathione S-transferase family protein [Vulgatibacter incomptus]AKU93125.1 Glutathione S-transferase [Vulgatibacter incomptus]
MNELVLLVGNKNSSSWSLRPWLALAKSGLPYRDEVVHFGSAEWERVKKVSPTGKVPSLVHGDVVVWDSLAICEYLAELAPSLWPEDRARRAEARAVCAEMHSGFPNLRRQLGMDISSRKDPGPLGPDVQAEIARVFAIWSGRSRFADEGPFLFGRFSIADAFYAPVVTRFVTYGIEVPGDARRYMDAILELPELRAWSAEAKREVDAGVR